MISPKEKWIFCTVLAFIIMNISCASVDFSSVSTATCNVQTTLDFNFHPDTTVGGSGVVVKVSWFRQTDKNQHCDFWILMEMIYNYH